MEIIESIGWAALGFLPMFGSMEVAWRLGKKIRSKKTIIEKVPLHVTLQSSIEAPQQLLHLGIPDGKVSDERKNKSIVNCQITKTSK